MPFYRWFQIDSVVCRKISSYRAQWSAFGGRHSDIHRVSDHRDDRVSAKLFKEAKIVFKKESEIVNVVTQHCQPVRAHTESEAGKLF